MKLSSFICPRCRGTVLKHSRRKGLFENVFTPLILISYYRCQYCGSRIGAFGIGENRFVIEQHTANTAWIAFMIVLIAGAIASVLSLLAYA